MDYARMRDDARSIFMAGVASVDPRPMVSSELIVEGSRLRLASGPRGRSWDLSRFERVLVLGFGKAGSRMAQGAVDALGARVSGGLVAVKAGHAEACERVEIVEAAHPVPDASSVAAARRIMALAREADERTLVLVLVSGGGSSLLCAPYDGHGRSLSLDDKAAVTRELLACGAGIKEINAVRRHLSAVKGGRLAEALAPATVVTLALSDVIGDELSSIASGPTVPDPTSWRDALAVLWRYNIAKKVPKAALKLLEDGAMGLVPDTPKPGDPAFRRVTNLVIGSNRKAALAARVRARELGYRALYLGSRMNGEARELALAYLAMGMDAAAAGSPLRRPACILAGGESTVTLKGRGKGGRNQEMALSFLSRLAEEDPAIAARLCFLSAGTDGNDGPTDAAGAYADLGLLSQAAELGLNPREYLAENDSYRFYDAVGGLLKTGPTNTNVCDLQILLVR